MNTDKKSKPIDLLMEDGKFSRTGLMFMVWMVFIMTMIGIVTFRVKEPTLPDIPEPYVYMTLVLCGTYTARRFLNDRYGKNTNVNLPTPSVTIPPVLPG